MVLLHKLTGQLVQSLKGRPVPFGIAVRSILLSRKVLSIEMDCSRTCCALVDTADSVVVGDLLDNQHTVLPHILAHVKRTLESVEGDLQDLLDNSRLEHGIWAVYDAFRGEAVDSPHCFHERVQEQTSGSPGRPNLTLIYVFAGRASTILFQLGPVSR